MSTADLVIRSQRVVTGEGPVTMGPAIVVIEDGVIRAIAGPDEPVGDRAIIDVGDRVVMAGLVDSHVHVNEPGRTEWEGYATATRAAAAGGITTLIDMPLNCIPPTTSLAALEQKRAAAAGQCHIDVGFWGGVVPDNHDQLRAMVDAGIMGFKCFLVDSGVPEFACVDEAAARRAMDILAEARVPLLAHAELAGPIEAAARRLAHADPRRYATYLASRPPAAEELAIELMITLCRATGAAVHIVHLSAASALPRIEEARDSGARVTIETCPHYLHFAAEDIADGATEFKCAPPIRERSNREALWRGLESGAIDMVVSDHSPCTVGLKRKELGDFMAAWGGVSSLQLTLPVIWTDARSRGLGIEHIAEWMCARPARLAGLQGTKGAIAVGHDADIVIWNPEAEATVAAAALHHRNKITPYHGERLSGVVEKTYVRGQLVHDSQSAVGAPRGRLLQRTNL